MEINTIGIVGTVAEAPRTHRNIYGKENVFALWVDTLRDSGTVDRILVLYQEDKVEAENLAAVLAPGCRIEATGKIQTYKNMKTGRVQLFVWGLYLGAAPDSLANNVYMCGEVAKAPVYRETPKGRRITEIMLRIPSAFTKGFYSYVPCIAWGNMADKAAELPEGIEVYIEGRLQSREYVKRTPEGNKKMTTWEVSINKLEAGANNGN